MDGPEQERLEIQHAKYLELLHGQLFLAPISATAQRILDLTTRETNRAFLNLRCKTVLD